MKKTYMEPRMIVEDFTVNEMVAAKCDFNPNNLFTSQMTAGHAMVPGCLEASNKAQGDEYLGASFAAISSAFEGNLDSDNVDLDNDWGTNNAKNESDLNQTYFNSSFQIGDNCKIDGMSMTFLIYDHKPSYAPVSISCAADAGSNPLQNS